MRIRSPLFGFSVSFGLSVALAPIASYAEPVTSIDDFFQPDGMATTAENYPTHETSRQLLIAQARPSE
jgi:hypothetical protein